MKKITLIFNILAIISINLISYATNQQIEINTDKNNIENGQEIEISIKIPSQENSIYTYSGEIQYDKEIFETIDNSNFTTSNLWENLQYNQENGQFIITNKGSKGNEEILKIKLKSKKNQQNQNTKINIKNLKTVDEKQNEEIISLENQTIQINIKNNQNNNKQPDKEDENTNNNKPSDNNSNEDKKEDNTINDNKDPNTSNNETQENQKNNNETSTKNESNQEEKDSIASGRLPYAGDNSNILLFIIAIILIIMICILIRYRKINKTMFILLLTFTITSNIYINTIQAVSTTAKKGDINLDEQVNNEDIQKLEKYLIGLEELSKEQQNNADIYEDQKINLVDLHYLIKNLDTLAKEEKYDLEQITPINSKVTYEPVVMANEKMKTYGTAGAGSQWPVSLETSNDGSLMLYGIDVAGLFKSTDHGKTWTRANSGLTSPGAGMFAIDPHNTNHVATLGLSQYSNVGGIHISYDKAETWNKTLKIGIKGYRYLWDGLEFDPTSYDSSKNYSTDLYFSTPYKRDTQIRTKPTDYRLLTTLQENEIGLYKSSDCGETFSLIINDPKVADGIIRFTDDGKLYIGNQYGLFLINTKTNKIEKEYTEFKNDPNKTVEASTKGVTGLDVVGNTLYIQTWDGIYTLENEKITKITTDTYDTRWPQMLTVSKSNPNHMVYEFRGSVTNYFTTLVNVTFDGGKTWQISKANLDTTFYYNVNFASREKAFIIDPSDDNNVITLGGDNAFRSSDGGINFVQASGISNMMQGGKFHFNYYNPDLMLFSAQDYTGVISTDGGKTFTNLVMNKGNFYGGFAADEETIYGFANSSWGGGTLTYTHDGGKTWIDTGLKAKYEESSTYYSSLQSITDPNVLFAQEYYSKDKGYTWQEMNGCVAVYAYNYTGKKELYGANKEGNVVVSYDNGDTWEIVTKNKFSSSSISEKIYDLSYDYINNYIYLIDRETYDWGGIERVYKYDINTDTCTRIEVPRDSERGFVRLRTIAVDPKSTSVIYVGSAGDYFSASTGLSRSIDGGKTWEVLTTANDSNYTALANNKGGYEVSCIGIDPRSGKVWLASGCYGYSTINPPYTSKK